MMAATLSVVPLYVKSKLELFVGENSLLSRAFHIPRSFVNMVCLIPSKILSTSKDNSYTSWIFAKLRPKGNWFVFSTKSVLEKEEHEERREDVDNPLRDGAEQKMSSFAITRLYYYILENNFLGITRESLELLRYESKVLEGLQDFEILTALKTLFGCMPSDNENTDIDVLKTKSSGLKDIILKTSLLSWRGLLGRLFRTPFVSWFFPFNMFTDKKETATTTTDSTLNDKPKYSSSNLTMLPSAGSLLMCETGLLPNVISDSGTYALSTTHDLLKEAVLLFVPMEILENTAELLKNPTLAISMSPMSAFWQLFNYVSIWGLDIMDEFCNQQEVNYAIIDDDDFHFVVNVPKLRRPIMFIGIR